MLQTCIRCCDDLPIEKFNPRKGERFSNRGVKGTRKTGLRTVCKDCHLIDQRRRYEKYKHNSFFKHKASRAKSRASSLKVPFDLDAEYLESIWTDTCPVSGVVMKRFADRLDEDAAELDRFVPKLGYVKSNVAFLSRKINRLKNNASLQELKRLVEWMENGR